MTMNLAFMANQQNPKYRFAPRENQILVISSVDPNNFLTFQPGFSIKFTLFPFPFYLTFDQAKCV